MPTGQANVPDHYGGHNEHAEYRFPQLHARASESRAVAPL